MRKPHHAIVSIAIITLAAVALLDRRPAPRPRYPYDELAKNEAAANADNGKRVAPVKSIANPSDDVSPEMQAMIGAPYPPHFNADPKTPAEWKELIDRRAKLSIVKHSGDEGEARRHGRGDQNRRRALLHRHAGQDTAREPATASWFMSMAAATCSAPAKPRCRKRS